MIADVLTNANSKMKKSNDILRRELSSIRTGHATPALLEQVRVDYQGVPTPIRHLANVSVPEARLLVIQPWDKSTLGQISKAIQTQIWVRYPTIWGFLCSILICISV